MKLSKFTNLLVLGLVLTVAVVGCRKRPGYITDLPGYGNTMNAKVPAGEEAPLAKEQPPVGVPISTNQTPNGEAIASNPPEGHENWAENREVFSIDTVHFAFDSSAVRPGDKPKVQAVADYLKNHAINAVKVEGHCDERGTAEYNRALGERRALALREQLVGMGVDSKRVDTISYGFDKPVDTEHNEAAWTKNRRGEFILLTPPGK